MDYILGLTDDPAPAGEASAIQGLFNRLSAGRQQDLLNMAENWLMAEDDEFETEWMRERIERYLADRKFKAPDDPLFATSRRQPMDRDALRKMLLAAGRRAEISEPVGPHRLRHTFAITYLRNGGDIFTLQRLLGHSSLDMVRRYLAIAQVDVAEAHRRASPADNWRLA